MSEMLRRAVHPGYYLNEYLEETGLTQDEFSKRLGISGKQVSLILAGSASITPDIAHKLSNLIGTSPDMWLNLQNRYDIYKINKEAQEQFEEEKKIYKMIDKNFLITLGIIEEKDNIQEAIPKLRIASLVSSLTVHSKYDIHSFYRTSTSREESIKNIVCKNVWVSIASNIARKEEVGEFNEKKLVDSINIFRSMTLKNMSDFYPELKKTLSECGVIFVLLPTLKNSNINGVVRWIGNNKVMMALNTWGAYNDKFWFSFFHELKHVLQKHKRKMIVNDDNAMESIIECEADNFAKEILIPSESLDKLTGYDEESIRKFSTSIGIHPGIVVGRLQKEGKIEYSKFNYLKEKYEIEVK